MESFGPKKFALVREQQAQLQALEAEKGRLDALRQDVLAAFTAEKALREPLALAEKRLGMAEQSARSLVAPDVLRRAEEEAGEAQGQLKEAQEEVQRTGRTRRAHSKLSSICM